jgi:hypothetical protein
MIARLKLELKNLKWLYVLPILVTWALIPLLNQADYRMDNDPAYLYTLVCTAAQQYLPFFASWWPILILKDYLHAPGRELLYIYRTGRDSLLLRMLVLWAWFMLHASVLFVGYTCRFGNLLPFFGLLCAQTLFMVALGYCVAMLAHNTFLPLLLNLCYCLTFFLLLEQSKGGIFILNDALLSEKYDIRTIWTAVSALGLFALGYLRECRLGRA